LHLASNLCWYDLSDMVKASLGAIGSIVTLSVSSSDDVEEDRELFDFLCEWESLVENCILVVVESIPSLGVLSVVDDESW